MTTGLNRVYWKNKKNKKWIFEAAFVNFQDAHLWIKYYIESNDPDEAHNSEVEHKIMCNGKKLDHFIA